jgi:LmbE family N-acetylglucosaminyl deacetylase
MAAHRLFSGPEDRRIKRALAIVAHPDDIEYYCGGTVLKMTSRGVLVDFVLATSGPGGLRHRWRASARIEKFHQVDLR